MSVENFSRILSVGLLIAGLSTGVAYGQAVSQISGLTKDQSGAVVPGVEVTAIDTDTSARRTVSTGESGEFVIPNLQIGPYRIEATKPGFQRYVQNGIELQVDSNPNIPITLGVGAVTDTMRT